MTALPLVAGLLGHRSANRLDFFGVAGQDWERDRYAALEGAVYLGWLDTSEFRLLGMTWEGLSGAGIVLDYTRDALVPPEALPVALEELRPRVRPSTSAVLLPANTEQAWLRDLNYRLAWMFEAAAERGLSVATVAD